MSDPKPQRLGLPRVISLSTLAFPLAGIGLPVGVYLSPFYADELGLGVALTGMLFMIMRIWDLAIDPVVGSLVDRVNSRWGRARPWIVACVPVLMVAAYFVYMPPREGVTALYFVFWMLVFYIGATFLQIARNAWVADVAVDYDDRSRHFVVIEVVSVLSLLFLLLLPVFIAGNSGTGGDRFAQISAMGWCLIISLPVTALLACLFVPDPPRTGPQRDEHKLSVSMLKQAISNPYLRIVLALEVLVGMGISVTSSLYLFVAESVFGLSDQASSLLLVVFFISSVVGLPVWMAIAQRTEKHTAVAAAVTLSALSFVLYYIVSLVPGFWTFAIGAVVNGFAFTAPLVIGRSMTADVVEEELSRTGVNRAGLYFGLNASAYKVGASLAIGVAYLLVGLVAGYEAGADNSPQAVQGLMLIFCLLPMLLYAATFFVIRNYPLDRKMQQEIAARLDAQKDKPKADDPLDLVAT
jgi:glycoside/pentoside/hexuronide:cation symporter, GPH family